MYTLLYFNFNTVSFESANYISQIPLLADFQLGYVMEGTRGTWESRRKEEETLFFPTPFLKIIIYLFGCPGS